MKKFLLTITMAILFASCYQTKHSDVFFEKKTKTVDAEMKYASFPKLPRLSEKIKSMAQQRYDNFIEYAMDYGNDSEFAHYFRLETRVYINKNILTITFHHETTYARSAHGSHGIFASLTYDLDKNDFTDLVTVSGMTLSEIGKFCYDSLPTDHDFKEWLLTPGELKPERFPFSFENGEITIWFEPYAVGPYAAGSFEVKFSPAKK